MEIPIDWEAN